MLGTVDHGQLQRSILAFRARRHRIGHGHQKSRPPPGKMRGRARHAREWVSFAIAGMAGIVAFGWGSAAPAKAERTAPVRELICRMVDAAAETYRLPSSFLTRVLWQKS